MLPVHPPSASSSDRAPRRSSLRARVANASGPTVRRGMDDLPATARELLRLTESTQAVLNVLSLFGGGTFYIPTQWPPLGTRGGKECHPFRRVLTFVQMGRVVQRYAGTHLYIPRCLRTLHRLRNARIVQRFSTGTARGQSSHDLVRALAKKFNISDRRVWEILKSELV